MKQISIREKIFQNIRAAKSKASGQIELKEPDYQKLIFQRNSDSLLELFAREFSKINGKFFYCQDKKDYLQQFKQLVFANKWKNIFCSDQALKPVLNSIDLKFRKKLINFLDADVSITGCLSLVARTGSIIVNTDSDKSRTMSVFPPVHIVVAFENQIVFDLSDAFEIIKSHYGDKYPSMISIISGPSRTADIEKTLVLGAHGPKELYCFYINERQ